MSPLQTEVAPAIGAGEGGMFRVMAKVLAALLPHEVVATTDKVPAAVNEDVNDTVMLRLPCPLVMVAPAGAVQ